MPKLSVIICVYNTDVAKFDECLQSVFHSTLKDIEVIVVDDGSIVDYTSIIEKYDVKYFKTENQGTLLARMYGIEKSSSPYVCFVDSDDTVSFSYLEANITKANVVNADIVINDWAFHTDHTRYVCTNDSSISTDFILEDNVLDKFFDQAGAEHSYYVLWNKVYRRGVLISAVEEIRRLDIGHLVYAEDVLINYFAFKYAKVITNVHLGYYFYRVHGDQQVSVETIDKLLNHVKSMVRVFDVMEKDLSHMGLIDKYIDNVNIWKRLICTSHYIVSKSFNDKDLTNKIVREYGIEQFKPYKNESSYVKHKVLPNNIIEIDEILKSIYAKDNVKIYAKKGGYVYDKIKSINELYDKHYILLPNKKYADVIIPKENVLFKQRLLHNIFIYKVGMLLFPKGSKIRQFLKRKI